VSPKARHCLVRARHLDNRAGKAAMVDLAVIWMRIAEHVEERKTAVQQQQQTQPSDGK
jgi:hypothetical protein